MHFTFTRRKINMIQDIIDGIGNFFDSLETWQKWLGTSVLGVGVFFLFLLIFAGPQQTHNVAKIPSDLRNTQADVTQQYIQDTKEPAKGIIADFTKAGKDMSKDVSDPVAATSIRFLMWFAGVMLAMYIILIPVMAIKKAFDNIL